MHLRCWQESHLEYSYVISDTFAENGYHLFFEEKASKLPEEAPAGLKTICYLLTFCLPNASLLVGPPRGERVEGAFLFAVPTPSKTVTLNIHASFPTSLQRSAIIFSPKRKSLDRRRNT